jgi:nicotinamidase-related amidase
MRHARNVLCGPTLTRRKGNTFETNPELAGMLKAQDVREIVAFGIQSECCVESTCRGAWEAGFGVTLLSGAHSTYDAEGKSAEEIELEVEGRLRDAGVKIERWEDIVARGF